MKFVEFIELFFGKNRRRDFFPEMLSCRQVWSANFPQKKSQAFVKMRVEMRCRKVVMTTEFFLN